jgi:MFS family permease
VGVGVNFKFLSGNASFFSKKLTAAVLLTSGTLAWFFLLAFIYLTDIFKALTLNNPFWSYYEIGQILFYGFVFFWTIMGSFVGARIERRKLLLSWISLGILATFLLALFQGLIFAIISSFLLGLSFGFGFPSSMAFTADCTTIEERARVCGAIILTTFIIAFAAIAIASVFNFALLDIILLLAVVRATSFPALFLDKCDENPKPREKLPTSPAYRDFILYLLPWVMFSNAAAMVWDFIPQTSAYTNAIAIGQPLRYVCIAIFGLISGFSADRYGRKQPIIIGLIILGISFAFLGFDFSPFSVLVYAVVSGIAWGLFFVVYLAIPGDLSNSSTREKFYGLTLLPFVIFAVWSAIPAAAFPMVSVSSFSLIVSVIVFLSIIPVFRARETLSTQKIQERKMKEHLNKIEELIQESKKSKRD